MTQTLADIFARTQPDKKYAARSRLSEPPLVRVERSSAHSELRWGSAAELLPPTLQDGQRAAQAGEQIEPLLRWRRVGRWLRAERPRQRVASQRIDRAIAAGGCAPVRVLGGGGRREGLGRDLALCASCVAFAEGAVCLAVRLGRLRERKRHGEGPIIKSGIKSDVHHLPFGDDCAARLRPKAR